MHICVDAIAMMTCLYLLILVLYSISTWIWIYNICTETCNGKSNSGHTLSKPLQPQVQGSPERSHDSHHVPSLHSHGHSLEEKLVGPLLPSCLPEAVSEVPEQLEGLWAQHSKLDHFALRHFCTPELRDLNGRDTSWLALTTVLLSYRLRGGQYYCI